MNLSGNLSRVAIHHYKINLDVTGSTTIGGPTTINSALTADSFTGDISNRNSTITGNLLTKRNSYWHLLLTARLDVIGINAEEIQTL